MKLIETSKLKIGDWILDGNSIKKGKFIIARVNKIEFDNFEEIDLDKMDIKDKGKGIISKSDGIINLLNKREIKQIQILRTKLKTLKGLEDKKIESRY